MSANINDVADGTAADTAQVFACEVDADGRPHWTPYNPCTHFKGWHDSIPSFWGRRRVFVCEGCATIFDVKTGRRV